MNQSKQEPAEDEEEDPDLVYECPNEYTDGWGQYFDSEDPEVE